MNVLELTYLHACNCNCNAQFPPEELLILKKQINPKKKDDESVEEYLSTFFEFDWSSGFSFSAYIYIYLIIH